MKISMNIIKTVGWVSKIPKWQLKTVCEKVKKMQFSLPTKHFSTQAAHS